MTEIGNALREAREAQRLSLADAERETRIRRIFLQALEEEQFDQLPGDVYTRGFIRNYALFLNLDPQPLLDEFDRLRNEPRQDEPEVLDEPLLPQRSDNIGARIFLILMALLVLFMALWYGYNRVYGGPTPADLLRRWGIQVRPSRTPTSEPTQVANEAATPSLLPSITPSQEPTQELAATATRTAFPTRTPTAIAGILVVADVIEDTWAHIVVDEGVVFDGTLLAGEQHIWQAKSLIDLSLGNAGGISLTVNNVSVGIPGQSGEVIELNYTLDTLPTPAP
ncbi:MAG: RodZ domain-containing protein [Anaerolineae bacterium]